MIIARIASYLYQYGSLEDNDFDMLADNAEEFSVVLAGILTLNTTDPHATRAKKELMMDVLGIDYKAQKRELKRGPALPKS